MFNPIHEPTGYVPMDTSGFTYQSIKDFIDTLAVGVHFFALSGPTTRAITDNVLSEWSTVIVYKRTQSQIYCEMKSMKATDPVCIFAKSSAVWDESISVRNSGGVTNVCCFPVREVA